MAKHDIDMGAYPTAPPDAIADRIPRSLADLSSVVATRFPEVLLGAIILALPFQVTKTLFPIQQIEISRILIALAIGWLVVRGRSRGWPLSRALTLSIGAVLVALVVSFAVTRWPNGILLVAAPIFYTAFAVFVATTVRDRFGLGLVALAMVVSGVVVATISILLEITGVYLWREGVLDVLGRANATFGDPNIAARFLALAMLTLLALVAVVRERDRRTNLVIGAAVVLMATGLVLTQSRFGWITTGIVVPLFVIVIRPRRAVLACAGLFLATFVVAAAVNGTAVSRAGELAAGVTYTLGGETSVESRGNLIGSEDVAYVPPRDVLGHEIFERLPIDGIRYYLLEAGVAMWQDHPIAGVGVGGYQPNLLGPYRDFIPRDRLDQPVSLPHTFLAQIAAENGIIGLAVVLVFLATLAAMAIRAARSRDPIIRAAAIATGLGILAVLLSSQVAGGFLVDPYLWLAVGVLAAVHRWAVRPPDAPAA